MTWTQAWLTQVVIVYWVAIYNWWYIRPKLAAIDARLRRLEDR